MKRISSVKHHNRIDRQISDVASKIIYTLPMILFKCILGTLDYYISNCVLCTCTCINMISLDIQCTHT